MSHDFRSTVGAQALLGVPVQQSLYKKKIVTMEQSKSRTATRTAIKDAAGLDTCVGKVRGAFFSLSKSFCRSVEYQGGKPVSISYITIPRFHQSTDVPWPCRHEASYSAHTVNEK